MPTPSTEAETLEADAGPAASASAGAADRTAAIESHESRNLLALAMHTVVLRIAWIFKTESVIMPAFLDAVAGAAWLRGLLPFLNRIGQSVPSLAFSERVRQVRHKKWALFAFTVLMSGPFLLLSLLWTTLYDAGSPWMAPVFLVLYFLFFTASGWNQLAFGTLQGKLIRPHRRGRLMGLAGTLGAVPAILCAWFLLQRWVTLPDHGFGRIFLFTGAGFLVAALVAIVVIEPADASSERRRPAHHIFRDAWTTLRTDRGFRNFCIVAMLIMSAQMLFPHYQALGRMQRGFDPVQLMVWVVAQNAGAGIFSPLAGVLADRCGNRLALRIEIAVSAGIPLLALLLTRHGTGNDWYWLPFCLLGLVPVTMRTLANYTLELSDPQHHPQYLGTMSVCVAVPFVLSPLFGLMIDIAGFEAVFCVISGLIALGGLLTLRVPEPRHGVQGSGGKIIDPLTDDQ
jgi:MFS family permease